MVSNSEARAMGFDNRLHYKYGAAYSNNPPSDQGCFIATAAYGTPMAEEIGVLRLLRDQKLLPTTLGTLLVRFYYRTSPPIADIIRRVGYLRKGIRLILNPLIKKLRHKI